MMVMIENTRESFLDHENDEYINGLVDWVGGYKIPQASDYRKLSVDDMQEAFLLAQLGQEVTANMFPNYKGKGPMTLTFTQSLIVGAAILSRKQADELGLDFEKYRSVLMVTVSRYGKSFLNAVTAICKAGVEGLEVRIGGASREKAGIIQEKIVELLPYANFDIQNGLVVTNTEGDVQKKIQRMSTQLSKDALTWTNGGSIKLFSTTERDKSSQVGAAGAIGIGGDFVILDEIQLMTPVGFRTSSRFMMESPETKRFCVGNPQINGHFRELYDDPKTFVIHTNDVTAIVEKRMTRRGIELTDIPTYSPEYRAFIQVEFPDENSGSRFFPTMPKHVSAAPPPADKQYHFIGIDSAYKGGDALMVTLLTLHERDGNRWVVINNQYDLKQKYQEWTPDTTLNVALDLMKIWEKGGVLVGAIDIGMGVHIYECMMSLNQNLALEPVNFGQKPTDWRLASEQYNATAALNARAEMHLDVRDLCENGLLYLADSCYDSVVNEMREISASIGESSKIKLESKKNIKSRLGRSPDSLDSLCLAVRAMIHSGILGGIADEGIESEADLVAFY